jgi:hypothetical protein
MPAIASLRPLESSSASWRLDILQPLLFFAVLADVFQAAGISVIAVECRCRLFFLALHAVLVGHDLAVGSLGSMVLLAGLGTSAVTTVALDTRSLCLATRDIELDEWFRLVALRARAL